MNKGDLVKVSEQLPNPQARFRKVGHGNWAEEYRYIEISQLRDKIGIIILDGDGDDCGTIHVAFGSTVIRAYQDYFTKLKKV